MKIYTVHKSQKQVVSFDVIRETGKAWYIGHSAYSSGYVQKTSKRWYTSLWKALEGLKGKLAEKIERTRDNLLKMQMTHDLIIEEDERRLIDGEVVIEGKGEKPPYRQRYRRSRSYGDLSWGL